MKKQLLLTLFLLYILSIDIKSQDLEDEVVNSYHGTYNTSSTYSGHWVKIATCNIVSGYQDFGTVFELFANGSSTNTIYYGKLIARIKRQNAAPGNPTHYSLILFDSNIGSENIKGVVNGTTVDFYIRINHTYTKFYYRRILRGSSPITALSGQTFLSALPSGDFIIDCTEGKISANQLYVDGNVGIGITNPSYKLTVDGVISAKEVKVSATPNSDYVFEPDYPLLALSEVEAHIKERKHLPGIPSAEQFKENGVGLGEMDDMLLRKVEELILYTIEQQKELEKLKKENEMQSNEIEQLKNKLQDQ